MKTLTYMLVAAPPLVAAACSKKEEKVMLAAPAAALTVSKASPEVKATTYAGEKNCAPAIDMPRRRAHQGAHQRGRRLDRHRPHGPREHAR